MKKTFKPKKIAKNKLKSKRYFDYAISPRMLYKGGMTSEVNSPGSTV